MTCEAPFPMAPDHPDPWNGPFPRLMAAVARPEKFLHRRTSKSLGHSVARAVRVQAEEQRLLPLRANHFLLLRA